jgi:predicted nucleic acid-binding protein
MVVVSNTSPLSNLAIIGRLEMVREQLGTVMIPLAVDVELGRNPNRNARAEVESAIAENWICVTALKGAVPEELLADLDIGEAEALALAVQINASLILLDDSAARAKAVQLAIPFTGALGILRNARRLEPVINFL